MECFSSSVVAENFAHTWRYCTELAKPLVTSLVRAKLAQGVTDPRLGEGRVTNLALRLRASAKLPNRIGSLPLSSRDRRSCSGASPKASHGAFCLVKSPRGEVNR